MIDARKKPPNKKRANTPIVYIAGPYTLGSQAHNVREMVLAADEVRFVGGLPFIPLLSHFWDLLVPHDYDFWMAMCLEWVERSAAVFRLLGESRGADLEIARARELGIPVFYEMWDLKDWIRGSQIRGSRIPR